MYTKGSAVEIQFSSKRLNDTAGDPFWIDLTDDEAARLLAALQQRVSTGANGKPAPVVFNLDPNAGDDDASAVAAATVKADMPATGFKQWVCIICGWVYDEAAGWPEDGIAPGTRWEDIPLDWRCPECDVGKEDFAMVEF